VACAEAYLGTKWHLNPSSPLATTDMDQKLRCFAHPKTVTHPSTNQA